MLDCALPLQVLCWQRLDTLECRSLLLKKTLSNRAPAAAEAIPGKPWRSAVCLATYIHTGCKDWHCLRTPVPRENDWGRQDGIQLVIELHEAEIALDMCLNLLSAVQPIGTHITDQQHVVNSTAWRAALALMCRSVRH